jgi:hypothetical protein
MGSFDYTKYAGKWHKMEAQYLFITLITLIGWIILIPFFYYLFPELFFRIEILVLSAGLFAPILFWYMYKKSKDMWMKNFNHDQDTVIKVVERSLVKNNIRYKKLRKDKNLENFPFPIVEIFEIDKEDFTIRIQRQLQNGTTIEIGPSNAGNEMFIEKMKNLLDDVFAPKGV